ncbi:MAG: hypothetical protein MJB14_06125 [Spirochaetes bacterium]|nr:hypothetical protein [Spirochaetota bacterium]
MKLNSIKCEAVDVKTETGICVGVAKTQQGEVHILDGRTPETGGMCANALCALSNAAFIMMSTDKALTGNQDYIERVCPHGNVIFRLSRSQEEKNKPFTSK